MAWTTPRTWTAGEIPTAANFNTHVRDNFNAIGGAWGAYTPTLTNWTLGNGTLTGSYMQVGQLIWGKVFYVVGSTDTKSGTLVISLPISKVADDGAGTSLQGTASLYDTSSGNRAWYFTGQSSITAMRFYSATGSTADPTTPWTWNTGDLLNATFMYEAA